MSRSPRSAAIAVRPHRRRRAARPRRSGGRGEDGSESAASADQSRVSSACVDRAEPLGGDSARARAMPPAERLEPSQMRSTSTTPASRRARGRSRRDRRGRSRRRISMLGALRSRLKCMSARSGRGRVRPARPARCVADARAIFATRSVGSPDQKSCDAIRARPESTTATTPSMVCLRSRRRWSRGPPCDARPGGRPARSCSGGRERSVERKNEEHPRRERSMQPLRWRGGSRAHRARKRGRRRRGRRRRACGSPRRSAPRAGDRRAEEVLDRDLEAPCPGALDDRRVEELRHRFGVEGCAHRDELEVGARAELEAPEKRERVVGGEASLVGFVEEHTQAMPGELGIAATSLRVSVPSVRRSGSATVAALDNASSKRIV